MAEPTVHGSRAGSAVPESAGCGPALGKAGGEDQRIAELLVQHFARIWRMARRAGLGAAQAEEAAQEAFIVLFERRAHVEPGKELAFLLSTVTHISRNVRRKASEARELPCAPQTLEQYAAASMPLTLLERKRACDQVDEILARLSEPLRVVFILYELEQLTLAEVAEVLDIPQGTAGSRLRLARKGFQKELRRLHAQARPFEEEP
jgi:RNA polymerase sigma-70 factor (ECF subfamily)